MSMRETVGEAVSSALRSRARPAADALRDSRSVAAGDRHQRKASARAPGGRFILPLRSELGLSAPPPLGPGGADACKSHCRSADDAFLGSSPVARCAYARLKCRRMAAAAAAPSGSPVLPRRGAVDLGLRRRASLVLR